MGREGRERPPECGVRPNNEGRLPNGHGLLPFQQCVEKYLKAVLLLREIRFPKTHDLIVLTNLLNDAQVRHHLNDLKRLNRYSIETRYPGEWEDIAREEAAEALQATMRIRAAVRCLIPEAGLPIGNANAAELDQQGPADPDPL